MKKEEIESWGKSFKKRPFYTVLLIIIILGIILGGMFFSGYFAEKGRRSAALDKTEAGVETNTEPIRDPNKIYQNDGSVGDVIGEVEEKGDVVIFKQLNNTGNLNRNIPFEYKNHTYQILRIETQIGIKIGSTNGGVGVLENVICKKLN